MYVCISACVYACYMSGVCMHYLHVCMCVKYVVWYVCMCVCYMCGMVCVYVLCACIYCVKIKINITRSKTKHQDNNWTWTDRQQEGTYLRHFWGRCVQWLDTLYHIWRRCVRWLDTVHHIWGRCVQWLDMSCHWNPLLQMAWFYPVSQDGKPVS